MRNEIPETGGSLGRLDFSSDGNRIAVGSGPGARVLEVSSEKVLLNLPARSKRRAPNLRLWRQFDLTMPMPKIRSWMKRIP
jgi:hypothetical protein